MAFLYKTTKKVQHNTKGSLIYCVGAHLFFCGPHKRLSLHCCNTNKFRQVGSRKKKKSLPYLNNLKRTMPCVQLL